MSSTDGFTFHDTSMVNLAVITAEQATAVAHVVERHATDDEDRSMLLEMLGLSHDPV